MNVREMNIDIHGDPEGLLYFAELLRYVAQEGSSYLDLVRADASGTGAYPENLNLQDERDY